MTSPVEFPLHGRLRQLEVSKEELMGFWTKAVRETGLQVRAQERVEDILREEDGTFTVGHEPGPLSVASRCTPGPGPPRHAAEARHSRRGAPQGDVQPAGRRRVPGTRASSWWPGQCGRGGDGSRHQRGNRVTLAYRGPALHRLKDRNARRLDEAVAGGRLQVLLDCQPVEVRPRSVVLSVAGQAQELENDYVWIFAGGTSPSAFLEKIGVRVGPRDLTAEVEQEAAAAAMA